MQEQRRKYTRGLQDVLDLFIANDERALAEANRLYKNRRYNDGIDEWEILRDVIKTLTERQNKESLADNRNGLSKVQAISDQARRIKRKKLTQNERELCRIIFAYKDEHKGRCPRFGTLITEVILERGWDDEKSNRSGIGGFVNATAERGVITRSEDDYFDVAEGIEPEDVEEDEDE